MEIGNNRVWDLPSGGQSRDLKAELGKVGKGVKVLERTGIPGLESSMCKSP